ncbi:MAG TPA: AAA family ATPase, partial [Bacteroidales bacterium]|nr:AAA family ATPase [Bacteroidales bacterium]
MIDQAESLRKRMLQTKAARKTAAVAMESPAAHPALNSVTYEEVPVVHEDAPAETEAVPVPVTPGADVLTENQMLTEVLEILEEVPDEPEVKKISDLKEKTGLVKIYAVVSGKGGVGKTNVSVNLSIAMAKLGKKVLLMDADIGMTNADIIMGIHYENDLFDYLEGRVGIEEIIYEGPLGVKVISGGAGLLEMNALSGEDQEALISDLIDLGGFDVMIIDNGAGI